MNPRRTQSDRHGLVLLIVLGVLALFSILAVTYLTFASNSRQAAFNTARREFHNPKPEVLMDEAVGQILRGTPNPQSALFRHDLLGDLYGYQSAALGVQDVAIESLEVRALSPAILSNFYGSTGRSGRDRGVLLSASGVVKIPLWFAQPQPTSHAGVTLPTPAPPENIYNLTYNSQVYCSPFNIDDTLTGRTLTILEGPLANTTLRILRWAGYRENTSNEINLKYSVFVEFDSSTIPSSVVLDDGTIIETATLLQWTDGSTQDFPACLFYNRGPNGQWGTNNSWNTAGWPNTDDQPYRMVINPIPRNSEGMSSATAQAPTGFPVRYQPNYRTWWTLGQTVLGNGDEPYDAPDYENMFLSYRPDPATGLAIIPSFHRPALLDYVQGIAGSNVQSLMQGTKGATLRPLPLLSENRAFTGGNPELYLRVPHSDNGSANTVNLVNALRSGKWDVDNDGDGIPDSIWIDPKLPIVTAEDGTKIRPLVAVQIEDLGSRFNLNAHGNLSHLITNYYQSQPRPVAGPFLLQDSLLPIGRGYGPAEIMPVLDSTASLNAILSARYQNVFGNETPIVPGSPLDDDSYFTPGHPALHTPITSFLSNKFGVPLDRFGRGVLAIDPFGNLYSDFAGFPLNATTSETVNDPYEFSTVLNSNQDSHYSLEDFGKIADRNRWNQAYDQTRKSSVIDSIFGNNSELAHLISPVSKSTTAPPHMIPTELAELNTSRLEFGVNQTVSNRRPAVLIESLLSRIIRDSDPANPNGNRFAVSRNAGDPVIDEQDILLVKLLLAPELRNSELLHLNRSLGNGLDDNGNGLVDEPLEELLELSYGGIPLQPTYNLSPVPAGPTVPAPLRFRPDSQFYESPREALARHIYCLAMLLMNDSPDQKSRWVLDNTTIPAGSAQLDRYIARRIAQWSVNVVDYRDTDSIMTRFLYDYNPLNGWNTNPLNTTDPNNPPEYDEVWGCEHPEMVFMESLAFHDLRVRDTKLEVNGKTKDDTDEPDEDTDQIRKPEGSAFLELYNPRSRLLAGESNLESFPAELYRLTPQGPVLALDALAPANPAAAVPMPQVPIWRIAISEPHATGAEKDNSPLERKATAIDTNAFEPHILDELHARPLANDQERALKLERFILFSHAASRDELDSVATAFNLEANGTYNVDSSNIFCNLDGSNNVSASLAPSTYLTVAPRIETRLGSVTWSGIPTGLSAQRFSVEGNARLVHYNTNGNRTTPETLSENPDPNINVQDFNIFYAQAFEPLSWNLTNNERNEIFGPGNFGIGFNISEPLPGINYYRKPTDYFLGQNGNYPLRDAYWDYSINASSGVIPPSDEPADRRPSAPISSISPDPNEPFVGSVPNFRTAYLQRLANPLLAFQPDPLQLNYNPYRTVDWIPMDLSVFSGEEKEETIGQEGNFANRSRQRTGRKAPTTNLLFSNIVNTPQTNLNNSGGQIPGTAYFQIEFDTTRQSLGYLNEDFGQRISRGAAGPFLHVVGQPLQLPPTLTPPFAIHPWLNRPYASPLELMMVPATSQTRLFEEFSIPSDPNLLYSYDQNSPQGFKQPFSHLLNFFDGIEANNVDYSVWPNSSARSHLYRIFEYLHAGSEYRGEKLVQLPFWSMGNVSATDYPGSYTAREFWSSTFKFPFNVSPNVTSTGKLNLNTISSQRVFAGLQWNYLTQSEKDPSDFASGKWSSFKGSRGGDWQDINGKPFTSTMTKPPLTAPPRLIGAGILRESGNIPSLSALHSGDQFQQAFHNNPDRSALIRYQSLMRLPNLVTDNSQVYLVRITMGFFEYNEQFGLGKEHLVDYGRNKRYRATYVIDRSLPVCYETGVDHDTRKCIIFEKFYRD